MFMNDGSKFSSRRPKGDAWGMDDAIAKAAEQFRRTGRSPMIPFVGVAAVSKIEMTPGDDGEPVYVAVVEIRRANSLDTTEAIHAGQRLILKAIQDREGNSDAIKALPVDERQIIMDAFGGVDTEELAQDDRELLESEGMAEPDNLRRHLTVVHGFDQAEVDEMEWVDVQKTHQAAHDPLAGGVMPHDVEWWAWRRVVLAERATELKAEGITWGEPTEEEAAAAGEQWDSLNEMTSHLLNVHRFDQDVITGESLEDLRHRHVADHETPPEDGFPAHDLAWLGSSADDLDAAEVQAEDDQTAADAVADETNEG